MSDLSTLVIDRRKWYRGRGEERSFLRNARGKMCCLGFRAIQCGYSEGEVKGVRTPAQLDEGYVHPGLEKLLGAHIGENSDLSVDAMLINDDSAIKDTEREKLLTELFSKHGIAITFEN